MFDDPLGTAACEARGISWNVVRRRYKRVADAAATAGREAVAAAVAAPRQPAAPAPATTSL
eukprot:8550670-Lingulodinium_polyedra.AAC.1